MSFYKKLTLVEAVRSINLQKIWHQVSLFAVTVVGVWALWKQGFHPRQSLIALMAIYAGIAFIFHAKKRNTRLTMKSLYCLAFTIGLFFSGSDFITVNAWLDSSLQDVGIISSPETDELGGPDFLTMGSEVYDDVIYHDLAQRYDMALSFDKSSLAVLRDGKLHKVKNDEGYFIVNMRENGNVILRPWNMKDGSHRILEATIENEEINIINEIKIPNGLHHWGAIYKNKLYYPNITDTRTTSELAKKTTDFFATCNPSYLRADGITVIDLKKGGGVVREYNILEKIAESGPEFQSLRDQISNCKDPLHINDAQPLRTKEQADLFPDGQIGDILVSIRNIDSIVLIDEQSGAIKWHLNGRKNRKFIKQHNPRLTERGTMIIFDNLGSNQKNGRARVVEIDPTTKEMLGIYEGTDEQYFGSNMRGRIIILNENQYMVQEQYYNKLMTNTIFVLTCENGKISQKCKREDVFTIDLPKHLYNNALIFPSKH